MPRQRAEGESKKIRVKRLQKSGYQRNRPFLYNLFREREVARNHEEKRNQNEKRTCTRQRGFSSDSCQEPLWPAQNRPAARRLAQLAFDVQSGYRELSDLVCSHACLCTLCVPNAHRSQKRLSDTWTRSHHVGTGNRTRILHVLNC